MPDYRLYRLDPTTGHIEGAENFQASNDVEAGCLVRERVLHAPMELWRGASKVARYEPDREMAELPPMKVQERLSL
jgi:hypothetical protein